MRINEEDYKYINIDGEDIEVLILEENDNPNKLRSFMKDFDVIRGTIADKYYFWTGMILHDDIGEKLNIPETDFDRIVIEGNYLSTEYLESLYSDVRSQGLTSKLQEEAKAMKQIYDRVKNKFGLKFADADDELLLTELSEGKYKVNEEAYDYANLPLEDGEVFSNYIEIMIFSPKDNIQRLRQFMEDKTMVRCIIDKDMYLWDAEKATHGAMINFLKRKYGCKYTYGNAFMFGKRTIDPTSLYDIENHPEDLEEFLKNYNYIKNLLGIDYMHKNYLEKVINSFKQKTASLSESNLNDNFKRWFKGSKVVDKKGNPLVCYHGTNKDFTEFNRLFAPNGFYFVTDKRKAEVAGYYAYSHDRKGKILPCYLSIQNPYICTPSTKEKVDFSKHDGIIVISDFDSNSNYYDYEQKELKTSDMKKGDIVEIIVFEPNQIKSIDNKGTWSENSDNIYENLNREIERYI